MADLQIGLMGCGRIAQFFHIEHLAHVPGARLAAYADPDPDARARTAAKAPGARAAADLAELLDDPSLDAVVICLPTGMHAETAVAAFEAGKHVYLEKPLATTAGDGRRIRSAWRASGRVGMMGFNNRYHPLYQEARRRLAAGAVGRVVGGLGVACSPTRRLPTWKRARSSGGGALLDLASHLADLVAYLVDAPVRSVQASLWSIHTEDDNAALALHLDGGVTVQLHASLTSAQRGGFEIFGDAGILAIDRRAGRIVQTGLGAASSRWDRLGAAAREVAAVPGAVGRALRPGAEPSYRRALEAFVAAAAQGTGPAVDIDDGWRNLTVLLAAEESARTGRAVQVAPAIEEGDGPVPE